MRRLCGALLGAVSMLALGAAAEAKTLVFCSEGSPEGFNPQLFTSGTTFDASSRQVYNRLIQAERGTTNLGPGLAESHTVSDDGKEYTFKLRQGVKWHTTKDFTPSRDFNADDVIFSFARMSDAEHPFHKLGGGQYEYFVGSGLADLLEKVEKLDEHTVRFVLKNPDATFIPVLSMDFASILSAEYGEQLEKAGTLERMDLEPVGTGPFQLVAYQKDAVIRFKANPDYYEGKAALDNLVFAITPDASVRWQKVKAGECHVMPYPNPADLEDMKANDSIKLMQQEGLNIGYLGFNVETAPMDDKRVRQALNLAINKQSIIDSVYQGAGVAAKNPMPPTLWGYNKAVEDYPHDPEKARKLLEEAGHGDGFKTQLWAMPVQRPYNPNARRMAELIQADWKEIGVDAEIVSYEWGEYLKRTQAGEAPSFMLGWTADIADPDNFLGVLLGCDAAGATNRARWCNEEFDQLIKKAKKINDQAERAKLYEEAQLVFKEDAPWVTIAHSIVFKPVRNEVVDFKIDPFGGHVFYGVDLEE
ncbi:ABC transporter substrate-binding protein [Geminicoccaceae bacterium 1502E]|nr:ABC transporter substrate-binding protein [Geminicoccaceae bacterium 1502E]